MILTFANKLCAGVGTLLVVAQMLLICTDVAMRTLASHPIAGVPEIVELAIVGLVFLQIPNAIATEAFIRSDGILHAIMRRRPKLGQTLDAVFSFVGAIVMAIITYGIWFKFQDAVDRNLFTGNPGLFTAPIWPALLCIVIGGGLGSLNFLRRMWAALRGDFLIQPEMIDDRT
jgi:TRAP-type C4-dicarboxylate transport system permease small subunit